MKRLFGNFAFTLFYIDFYLTERCFGFGIFEFTFETEDDIMKRNLFNIYYGDGCWCFGLFWVNILDEFAI